MYLLCFQYHKEFDSDPRLQIFPASRQLLKFILYLRKLCCMNCPIMLVNNKKLKR